MDFLKSIVDLFLHLDEYLSVAIQTYGIWTYALLFVVIFIETGLVVTPFLPGDSLLFAAGTFAALGSLNIYLLWGLLVVAAVLGDTANYWIGHKLGLAIFDTQNRLLKKVLKKEYLEKTEAFYAKHGGKTIVLARFVPIVRTFARLWPVWERWNTAVSFPTMSSAASCGLPCSCLWATSLATSPSSKPTSSSSSSPSF